MSTLLIKAISIRKNATDFEYSTICSTLTLMNPTTRKKYYIGLATSVHDPAIAIVNDCGKVLFAEDAERRYQVKKATGCAPDNIAWAEELAKVFELYGSDYTITKSWTSKTVRKGMLLHLSGILRFDLNIRFKDAIVKAKKALGYEINNVIYLFKCSSAVKLSAGAAIERALCNYSDEGLKRTITYDHHLSHAGLACYSSPFDEAICLVADGAGEGGSFSIYKYKGAKISLLEKQKGSATLGGFYTRLTVLCNFHNLLGEEWKVMGMAAYGSYNREIHELFKSMFFVEGCNIYNGKTTIVTVARIVAKLKSEATDLFTLKANIAYNGQLAYCEWMNEILTNIHKKYGFDNLILTGGCALNSSHNGEILDKTPFKNLYVPSAPGDDGCALGSALLAWYNDHPLTESIHKNISPYLGTEITEEHLQHFLHFSAYQKVRKLSTEKYTTVAQLLADGKIVAWMQGGAEFGPRALGNRSILADPRKKEIKDTINERVKFREEFRPFAPSILHEYGPDYFEHYQESHYMERTLTFKKEAIDKVPGVVHVNNTGRLQTVKEEWNNEFYYLLKAFHKITGVPVLLNTSFNVMGKPIVHSVEDALSTFFTSGIDALVINNYLIEK